MIAGQARHHARAEIRSAITAAAANEFAERGFEGASLRTIAAAAGVLQPQIHYHFGSKLLLWEDVVDALFAELDIALTEVLRRRASSEARLAAVRIALERQSVERPALLRMVLHEGTSPTDRLDWLAKTHLRPLEVSLQAVAAEGSDGSQKPASLLHTWVSVGLEHALAPLVGALAR